MESKHNYDCSDKYSQSKIKKFFAEKEIFKYEIDRYDATTTQNFKKTSWKKLMYSCGGYGGRCNNCKHREVKATRDKFKRSLVKDFKDILVGRLPIE